MGSKDIPEEGGYEGETYLTDNRIPFGAFIIKTVWYWHCSEYDVNDGI